MIHMGSFYDAFMTFLDLQHFGYLEFQWRKTSETSKVSIKMSYIFYVLKINQSLKSENMMTDFLFWMNYSE